MDVFVVPPTLAMKGIENPAFTVAVAGAMLNVTGCNVMETIAVADGEDGLVAAVAVIVAVPLCGTEEGAVYSPD